MSFIEASKIAAAANFAKEHPPVEEIPISDDSFNLDDLVSYYEDGEIKFLNKNQNVEQDEGEDENVDDQLASFLDQNQDVTQQNQQQRKQKQLPDLNNHPVFQQQQNTINQLQQAFAQQNQQLQQVVALLVANQNNQQNQNQQQVPLGEMLQTQEGTNQFLQQLGQIMNNVVEQKLAPFAPIQQQNQQQQQIQQEFNRVRQQFNDFDSVTIGTEQRKELSKKLYQQYGGNIMAVYVHMKNVPQSSKQQQKKTISQNDIQQYQEKQKQLAVEKGGVFGGTSRPVNSGLMSLDDSIKNAMMGKVKARR